MTELVERSATWMARAVRTREVPAVDLFDAHAARIAERDPAPNGSKLLAGHVSDADCAAVARMRAAGAILLGKTNVSESR